jgi:quercetin dioxygenase-like cupin family protein
VESVATYRANSINRRHTHPGEMVGYVLRGAIVLKLDGKDAVTYTAGQTFIIPAEVAHSTANPTGGEARMLATYFVKKGSALSTSAP